MHPKSDIVLAALAIWMVAAVSCAAMPVLHAVSSLKEAGTHAPLLAALALGLAVGVPLTLAVRRLGDLGSPTKTSWALFEPAEAALFGVIAWGLPVGLIFVSNEFQQSSELWTVIPGLVLWPLAGVAFGLWTRWLARRAKAQG